jgi:hypothetical protein
MPNSKPKKTTQNQSHRTGLGNSAGRPASHGEIVKREALRATAYEQAPNLRRRPSDHHERAGGGASAILETLAGR